MGSVPVELFQDCRVGVFKQPLLGGGGGAAGVHEDPAVALAAVHAAAADWVVQGLVLQNTKVTSRVALGIGSNSSAGMATRQRGRHWPVACRPEWPSLGVRSKTLTAALTVGPAMCPSRPAPWGVG